MTQGIEQFTKLLRRDYEGLDDKTILAVESYLQLNEIKILLTDIKQLLEKNQSITSGFHI